MTERKWKLAGIHGIRRFIWHLMQQELGWTTTPYRGAQPVITPQQAPEFNDYGAPYIVYNYSHLPTAEDYFLHREQAVFTVYAADEEDVREVINVLYEYFKAHDDSAKIVNYWLGTLDNAPEYQKYDYKIIRVTSSVGASPADQEGARHSGSISIYYTYTREDRVDYGIGPSMGQGTIDILNPPVESIP